MFSKRASVYMDEFDEMFKKHPEAVLTLYAEGIRAGRRSTLFFVTVGIVMAGICSCAAVLAYLDHKEQP